jgi:hypothetical protein
MPSSPAVLLCSGYNHGEKAVSSGGTVGKGAALGSHRANERGRQRRRLYAAASLISLRAAL